MSRVYLHTDITKNSPQSLTDKNHYKARDIEQHKNNSNNNKSLKEVKKRKKSELNFPEKSEIRNNKTKVHSHTRSKSAGVKKIPRDLVSHSTDSGDSESYISRTPNLKNRSSRSLKNIHVHSFGSNPESSTSLNINETIDRAIENLLRNIKPEKQYKIDREVLRMFGTELLKNIEHKKLGKKRKNTKVSPVNENRHANLPRSKSEESFECTRCRQFRTHSCGEKPYKMEMEMDHVYPHDLPSYNTHFDHRRMSPYANHQSDRIIHGINIEHYSVKNSDIPVKKVLKYPSELIHHECCSPNYFPHTCMCHCHNNEHPITMENYNFPPPSTVGITHKKKSVNTALFTGNQSNKTRHSRTNSSPIAKSPSPNNNLGSTSVPYMVVPILSPRDEMSTSSPRHMGSSREIRSSSVPSHLSSPYMGVPRRSPRDEKTHTSTSILSPYMGCPRGSPRDEMSTSSPRHMGSPSKHVNCQINGHRDIQTQEPCLYTMPVKYSTKQKRTLFAERSNSEPIVRTVLYPLKSLKLHSTSSVMDSSNTGTSIDCSKDSSPVKNSVYTKSNLGNTHHVLKNNNITSTVHSEELSSLLSENSEEAELVVDFIINKMGINTDVQHKQ